MCTALLRITPDARPNVLLGTRDEFTDRSWAQPAAWWPADHPGVVGGHDSQAGGSWLAVHPARRLTAMVLNRTDVPDPDPRADWRTRGELPLLAVEGSEPADPDLLRRYPPYRLLLLSDRSAHLTSWDGHDLHRRELPPGTHLLGNEGLDQPHDPRTRTWLPELDGYGLPDPTAENTAEECWGRWLRPVTPGPGDGTGAPSLLVRKREGHRVHATVSVSAVVVGGGGVRYDFLDLGARDAGAPRRWRRVL